LTRDHIDYHGDLESYLDAKTILFDGRNGSVPQVSVINIDDAAGKKLAQVCRPRGQVITFGIHGSADIQATEIVFNPRGSDFTVQWSGKSARFTSPLPGEYNISNILCALGLAAALGHDPLSMVDAVKTFPGVAGRMERVEAGQAFPVYVDYAHTDDALRNAIQMLRSITPGRVLCVFGCGGNRDRENVRR
jgi:UDP-N-acetylmuramoyl-L-alanyl-D-glutamate--2,6-diaminopimelate ligase